MLEELPPAPLWKAKHPPATPGKRTPPWTTPLPSTQQASPKPTLAHPGRFAGCGRCCAEALPDLTPSC